MEKIHRERWDLGGNNRRKLSSLWQGAFRTRITPHPDILFGWAVEVVLRSMRYYSSEVADCGDTDCEVCNSMIHLGEVLDGLVKPVGDSPHHKANWEIGLKKRLESIGRSR